jgi:hypothetical protein
VAAAAQSKTSNRLYDLSDDSSSPPDLIANAKKKSKHTKLKEEENMGPCEGPIMVTYARRQVNQLYFDSVKILLKEQYYSCKFRSFMLIAPQ